MKKLAYFFLMSCLACLSVFALYDEPVKVLRIFNGGVGTTIQLSHVDSLVFLPAVAHEQIGEMSVVYSLDSIYSIPIGSIEYIKVDEVDMEEYQSNINSIEEYIEEHETQPVTVFQDNLIAWLNQQDWVDKTVIDEGHNNITVIDKNGVPFYIYLQDMSFFDVPDGYQTKQFLPRRVTGTAKSVDVSHLENEQIIDRNQVLYFRGMDFPWLVETVIHEISGEEYSNITQICSQAPVKTELKKIEKSIEMFQKETDLSEYAVVIIGNTHGAGNGCFLVEDPSYGSLSQKCMCITSVS